MSKKQNKINNIFFSFVVILLIGIFVFSTIKVIKYTIDNKQNEKIEEEISDLVEYVEEDIDNEEEQEENNDKYNIDFEALKTKNSDTVGYLKVNGTDIENVVAFCNNR